MPTTPALNPLTLTKFVAWIVVAVVATLLLVRRKMTRRTRLAFVVGGTLLFGLAYGAVLSPGLNPNPPSSLRTVLRGLLAQGRVALPVLGMLVVLLLATWVSNKVICGYGCQLGLLQDWLHRVPLPKWQPPFRLSNSVRAAAFVALIITLGAAGLDWIGVIDPFEIFQFNLTLPVALTAGAVLIAGLFVYRPWCRFLCPFGFMGCGAGQPLPSADQPRCVQGLRGVREGLPLGRDGGHLRRQAHPRRLLRLRRLHRGVQGEGCLGLAKALERVKLRREGALPGLA